MKVQIQIHEASPYASLSPLLPCSSHLFLIFFPFLSWLSSRAIVTALSARLNAWKKTPPLWEGLERDFLTLESFKEALPCQWEVVTSLLNRRQWDSMSGKQLRCADNVKWRKEPVHLHSQQGTYFFFLYPTVSSGTIGLYRNSRRRVWVCVCVSVMRGSVRTMKSM